LCLRLLRLAIVESGDVSLKAPLFRIFDIFP